MLDLQDFLDDIQRHIDDYDFPSADSVINEIIAALDRGTLDFTPRQARTLLNKVRGARQFDTMTHLAQAFMRAGCDDLNSPLYAPIVRRQYAQALIEMSQLSAAVDVLQLGLMNIRTALDNKSLATDVRADLDGERRELLGLTGRANKQIYMDAVQGVGRKRAAARLRGILDTGLMHYAQGAENTTSAPTRDHLKQQHWPLINMVALAARRERDGGGRAAALWGDWQAIAAEIERELTTAVKSEPALIQSDPWLLASLGEACVAAANFPEAMEWYAASCDSEKVDAFQIASSIRQLVEVWGIDPESTGGGGALVQFLRLKLVEKPGGALLLGDNASHLLDLVESSDGLKRQSLIDNNTLERLATFRTGIARAGMVAGVYAPNVEKAIGTAFLVKGSDLHPSFGDRPVALTAAHVVSDAPKAVPAGQAILRFNETDPDPAKPKPTYRCKQALHLAAAGGLDFTVLEIDGLPDGTGAVPVRSADEIPRDLDRLMPPQRRCWVLGHAEGGEMALALDNSRLLDIGFKANAPRHADYLRYSSSTLPGQSGGPVFDRDWHLIGLHQAGISEKMIKSGLRRLGGKPGRHVANEGLSLKTIVETIATEKGGTKTQVAMPAAARIPSTVEALAAALADSAVSDDTVESWFETPTVQNLVQWPDPSGAETDGEASRTAAEIVGYGAVVGISQALRFRRNIGFDKRRSSAPQASLSFVSEGDSWFQYPLVTVNDTIDHLQMRYPVYCRAIAGMEITNILADTSDVMKAIEEKRPDAVLLSGGGNDLLGYGNIKNFVRLAADGAPVEAFLKPRLDSKIADLVSLFDEFTGEALRVKGDLKFFIHGYDHARSRNGGRWLRKPMRDHVGIKSVDLQNRIVEAIVDRFNEALAKFAADRHDVVHYVDCRGLMKADEWMDELHPNSDGFGRVADAFDRSIRHAFKGHPALKAAASSS